MEISIYREQKTEIVLYSGIFLIQNTKGPGKCVRLQDVRTCLIQNTKGPGKCVRLYRISEPV
jgi:hypothetical protein